MTEEQQAQTVNAAQAAAGDQSQADETAQAATSGSQAGAETLSLEEARKLRAEANSLRKRLKELEAQNQKYEAASLSEAEKLQKRLADLEAQHTEAQRLLQESTLRYEVMLAASRHGIVDPEAAVKLLDMAALEFDEAGRPSNLEATLKAMLKARPYLTGQGASAGSATNPARQQHSNLTFDDIKHMSPEEVNRRWAEVQAVLAAGPK